MSAGTFAQIHVLARRSMLQTLRQPFQLFPIVFFPAILLAVNASGLKAATRLPGFPTHSYVSFAIAVAFIQGGMFAMINTGTNLAQDIQSGFFNRLALTPLRRTSLLGGILLGVAALGLLEALAYLLLGLVAGAEVLISEKRAEQNSAEHARKHSDADGDREGPSCPLRRLGQRHLSRTGLPRPQEPGLQLRADPSASNPLTPAAALRTGSGEAVQGLFPLFFVFIFLSSSNLPRNLLRTGWFHTVATWNPISYLVEGFRSLFIYGWDGTALWRGFAVAAALAALALMAAVAALRTRLQRT